MAWVPSGISLKVPGRTTLRRHHDFDESFSFGKHGHGTNQFGKGKHEQNESEPALGKHELEKRWAEEGRTTVSQSQNKDIERFWEEAKKDSTILKRNLCMEDAAANRELFADSKSKHALRFDDSESQRAHKSHYKSTFTTSALVTPKATDARPRSAVDPREAVDPVVLAKKNKALGKQSSLCLTYY